jgi:hypothetical protein
MRARLVALWPLVSEYGQLRQAMAALEEVPSAREPPAAKRRAGSLPRRKRPPAGTNRERVLAAVQDNPGASASQIADASGVQRTVVYGVLRRLSETASSGSAMIPRRAPATALQAPNKATSRPPAPRHRAASPQATPAPRTPTPRTEHGQPNGGHAAVRTDSMAVDVDNGGAIRTATTAAAIDTPPPSSPSHVADLPAASRRWGDDTASALLGAD